MKKLQREKWGNVQRFLNGFKLKYLQKVIKYHHLTCADIKQQRCIYKSIREANLSREQIWEAVIHFGVEVPEEERK